MTDKNTSPVPASAPPALTCDPVKIAADIKSHIDALTADAAALTPLLGFALTSLRGALSAIEGHVKAAAPPATAGTGE